MQFGKSFLKARNMLGVEQKYAAMKLEISPGFLSKIETGKKRPSIELIIKASELYRVKPGFFFGEEQTENHDNTETNKLIIDLKDLSDTEAKGAIAFIRALRELN